MKLMAPRSKSDKLEGLEPDQPLIIAATAVLTQTVTGQSRFSLTRASLPLNASLLYY